MDTRTPEQIEEEEAAKAAKKVAEQEVRKQLRFPLCLSLPPYLPA